MYHHYHHLLGLLILAQKHLLLHALDPNTGDPDELLHGLGVDESVLLPILPRVLVAVHLVHYELRVLDEEVVQPLRDVEPGDLETEVVHHVLPLLPQLLGPSALLDRSSSL